MGSEFRPSAAHQRDMVPQDINDDTKWRQLQVGEVIEIGDWIRFDTDPIGIRWWWSVDSHAGESVREHHTVRRRVESPTMAYEDLPPGSELLPGDEWKNGQGRWVEYNLNEGVSFAGVCSRRPHNITQMRKDYMKVVDGSHAECEELRKQLSEESRDVSLLNDLLGEEQRSLADAQARNWKLSSDMEELEAKLIDELSAERRETARLKSELAVALANLHTALSDVAKASAERDRLLKVVDFVMKRTEELESQLLSSQQALKELRTLSDAQGDELQRLTHLAGAPLKEQELEEAESRANALQQTQHLDVVRERIANALQTFHAEIIPTVFDYRW